MIDVSRVPIGSAQWPGPPYMERMGDPVPAPGVPDGLFVMLFPYPQPPGQPTYASWPVGATAWQSSLTIGAQEMFQVSAAVKGKGAGVLHVESGGPVDFLMVQGLF